MTEQGISLKGVHDILIELLKRYEKTTIELAAERLITDSTITYLLKNDIISHRHLDNMESSFGDINPELSAIIKHRIDMIRDVGKK